jgi:hypothetical protein
MDPMAYYFCNRYGCDCKSLHFRMENGWCQGCDHARSDHHSHFNKHILNPIRDHGVEGAGKEAMLKLQNEILDVCLLRRTKQTRADEIKLPPRLVTIRFIKLHPVEGKRNSKFSTPLSLVILPLYAPFFSFVKTIFITQHSRGLGQNLTTMCGLELQ